MFGKDWRMRWMYSGAGVMLHRVRAIDWNEDEARGDGVTACGRMDEMTMPGILGRAGSTRCPVCCDLAGVPRGRGAPFNQGIDA